MHVLSIIIIIKVGTGIVHVVPDRIMALHFQLDFDASLLAPAPAQCKQLTDARVMFCSACLGARGAFPGGGRQRQGPRAGDSGGREEAGRVAPRRGAEEAVVRHVAAAVHVDRRRQGRGRLYQRQRRRLLRAARGVHGAGRPAQEPARRRLPHHHQAAEGFLAPGLRSSVLY